MLIRDEDTQIVALGIVNAMVPKLSATELQTFLPAITGFSNHPSVACRQIMMKILMWTYDNYRYCVQSLIYMKTSFCCT